MKGMIFAYCKRHGISISDLADISAISRTYLFYVNRTPSANVSVDMINKLAMATHQRFNDPLLPHQYLIHEIWLMYHAYANGKRPSDR